MNSKISYSAHYHNLLITEKNCLVMQEFFGIEINYEVTQFRKMCLSVTFQFILCVSLAACLYAFFIQQHVVRLVGHRTVFVSGLFIFTVTMAATILAPSVTFLNVVTALSGIGFAALTSTPNMLVTLYNSDRQVRAAVLYISNLLVQE